MMKGYFAKEGMTPDELLGRLISSWRNSQA
jgi:hypothetical protein